MRGEIMKTKHILLTVIIICMGFLPALSEGTKSNQDGEIGRMIVITTEKFRPAVEPLVTWKNRKGIATELYLYPQDTGSKPEDIKAFVQADYKKETKQPLKYVLIVGDAEDVPTGKGTFDDALDHPSDTYYTVLGPQFDDLKSYPANVDLVTEIMIGRFSVENIEQARTVVNKNLWYEMTPTEGAKWYHKAAGFADNDPYFTPEPRELMDEQVYLVTQHLFSSFKKMYDPDAKASQIVDTINSGVGLFLVNQHGWHRGWGNFFNIGDVARFHNTKKTPIVLACSCSVGDFAGKTCFAEAWQRLGTPNEPQGSVFFLASSATIWHLAWRAQEEMMEYLAAGKSFIAGEIVRAGIKKMIALFPHGPHYEGPVTVQIWHIFGDPSLFVYTDTPTKMTVSYAPSLPRNSKSFTVNVKTADTRKPIKKALVALYKKGKLYGSAWTDTSGTAEVPLDGPVPPKGIMEVNVTAYNKVPYLGTIPLFKK